MLHQRRNVLNRSIAEYSTLSGIKDKISEFAAKNNIKTKNVSLVLNSGEIAFKCATMSVPPAEVGGALKYSLKSYIMTDSSKYIVDYKITRVRANKTGVIIAAAPKPLIENYVSLFKEINMSLVRIEPYQSCISKAFSTKRNALIISERGAAIQLIFLEENVLNGFQEIPFVNVDSVIDEISNLFDLYLTGHTFEFVFLLSDALEFLEEHFKSQGIVCSMVEKTDFLALESAISNFL